MQICVSMFVCVQICVFVYIQRPEVNAGCLLQALLHPAETRSLTDPGACQFSLYGKHFTSGTISPALALYLNKSTFLFVVSFFSTTDSAVVNIHTYKCTSLKYFSKEKSDEKN